MPAIATNYCPFCNKPMGDKAPILPDKCYGNCPESQEWMERREAAANGPIWRHSRLDGVQVRDPRDGWRTPTDTELELIHRPITAVLNKWPDDDAETDR